MIKESKPIIGILPTFNLTNEENDPYLDTARFVTMYSERITEAGGIPIGILNENVEEYFSICDGYLWCGGEKINSSFNTCILDAGRASFVYVSYNARRTGEREYENFGRNLSRK